MFVEVFGVFVVTYSIYQICMFYNWTFQFPWVYFSYYIFIILFKFFTKLIYDPDQEKEYYATNIADKSANISLGTSFYSPEGTPKFTISNVYANGMNSTTKPPAAIPTPPAPAP